MTQPLLVLQDVSREYPSGDNSIAALRGINLSIPSGAFVAIVGASGSGKSTLLNILGCLDKPTRGRYWIGGAACEHMDADALAALRREHFGFIFQRYHLLSDLNARENVEAPAIYASMPRQERMTRACALLDRLGLADRQNHRPAQLSGGQQQRVSIARALMNGGRIILADEPTGALDKRSGQDMLTLLQELNSAGHTIIIVTHDMNVAQKAHRIIEISDGEITADRQIQTPAPTSPPPPHTSRPKISATWGGVRDRYSEALRIALRSMLTHRMRTLLTMLGIIIGIASVVSVVALGAGSQARILKDINAMGTNTLNIYPGKAFGDKDAQKIQTLVPSDADALAEQSYIDSATPVISTSVTLRYNNRSANAMVLGVGPQYFQVRDIALSHGRAFDESGVKRIAQDVVIDQNTHKQLFGLQTNPLGRVLFLGDVPCRVIGVIKPKESGIGNDENLNIIVPYTTAMARITGQYYLKSIMVRLSDQANQSAAEDSIVKLLTQRHRTHDVYVFNTTNIRKTIESATATMRLLTGMIALISLIVGGIGVMNIMLVSVTERTKEIGVRMAIGARQSDIMKQFLIESVLVCLIAGIIGVLAALGFGAVFSRITTNFSMLFSPASVVAAFACSTVIGIVFGYLPARGAAKLDPVDSLARD